MDKKMLVAGLILVVALGYMVFSLVDFINRKEYHGFDYYAASPSDCSVQCEDYMKEYDCYQGSPTYRESWIGNMNIAGFVTNATCSCYVTQCKR